jgi:hypothetical protein
VLPSGAERLISDKASRPAAPGLLSTITLGPSDTRILSASSRATWSAEPPGGKPTTMRVVRSCASARPGASAAAASAAK